MVQNIAAAGSVFSFSDNPILKPDEDRLGFSWFAEELAQSISRWDKDDCLVLALYADWGNGKTSVKNMCLEYLQKQTQKPIVVEFNPWCLDGSSGLIDSFFSEMSSALFETNEDLARELKNLSGIYKGAIPFIAMFCSLALAGSGTLIEKTLKGVADVLDRYAQDAHDIEHSSFLKKKKKIDQQLSTLDRRILIVIDDIDRLSRDEIKTLFRLLKSTADFSNVTYLLLFERNIVESVLNEEYKAAGNEYLQKIIQVGLNVPKILPSHLHDYAKLRLTELFSERQIKFDEQRLAKILHLVSPYFLNLRSIHRLLNSYIFQINLFERGGQLSVNPVDLLGIEVVREFESDFYNLIYENLDIFAPTSLELSFNAFNLDTIFCRQIQNRWSQISSKPSQEALTKLQPLLEYLFPGFSVCLSADSLYKIPSEELMVQNLSIAHSRLSRRYFHFSVPTSDLAQSEVKSLVDSFENQSSFAEHLKKYKGSGLFESSVGYLADYANLVSLKSAEVNITVLLDACELDTSPNVHAWCLQFIDTVAKRIDKLSERSSILKKSIRASNAPFLAADLIYSNVSAAEKLLSQADVLILKRWFLNLIKKKALDGSLQNHPGFGRLLFIWEDFEGNNRNVKKYVRQLARSVQGCLDYLQIAVVRITGTRGPRFELDLTLAYKFLSPQWLKNKLKMDADKSNLSDQQASLHAMYIKAMSKSGRSR